MQGNRRAADMRLISMAKSIPVGSTGAFAEGLVGRSSPEPTMLSIKRYSNGRQRSPMELFSLWEIGDLSSRIRPANHVQHANVSGARHTPHMTDAQIVVAALP